MAANPNCEKHIGDFNDARGFFGADCGTWFGGLSKNCKSQEYYAYQNREACYAAQGEYAQGKETTATLLTVLKWGAIAILIYFTLKWYLK